MDIPVEIHTRFGEGISDFSFDLYGAVPKHGNECISPYSISSALLLLSLGTDDTTEKQIMTSMFSRDSYEDVHIDYRNLNDKLPTGGDGDFTLSIVNGMFGSKLFVIIDTYKANALKY